MMTMTNLPSVEMAGRKVGGNEPCFVIAEAGVNHNGDVALAKQLIDAAKAAGADAVKFQTFRAELVVSPQAPKATYQKQTTGAAESQLEMVKKLELSAAMHRELIAHCADREILFLSTPFDEPSVDLLESYNVPIFKVPSGEVTNWPLLRYVAQKGRPMILSTGMSTLAEVAQAVEVIEAAHSASQAGNAVPLILLHCVSQYPAPIDETNLRAMVTMRDALQILVGYSDHTLGTEAALAAVALGACVIEKHFTLAKTLPGPDHRASLEPAELTAMIAGIRAVESALGNGRKRPAPCETETLAVVRRQLVMAVDVPKGTVLANEHVTALRPAGGISPTRIDDILGRPASHDLSAGTALKWSDLA